MRWRLCQFHDSSIGNWCCFSKSRLQAQTAIFAFLTFIELDKFIRPKKCKRYVNFLSELFFSDVSSLSRSSERMEHVAVETEVPEYWSVWECVHARSKQTVWDLWTGEVPGFKGHWTFTMLPTFYLDFFAYTKLSEKFQKKEKWESQNCAPGHDDN